MTSARGGRAAAGLLATERRAARTSMSGPNSGHLQRQLLTRRRPRSCTGLQTQMGEDALDDRRLQDRGDDLQLAAAIGAVLGIPLRGASHEAGGKSIKDLAPSLLSTSRGGG